MEIAVRESSRSAFRSPQYVWLIASNLAFLLGIFGQAVVRSWIVFQLTGSTFALGQLTVFAALPMMVFAPFGGVAADRIDRRKLIALTQIPLVVTELVVWGLLLTDRLEFWHLIVASTLFGLVFPFSMPGRQAIVAELVPREELPRATAISIGVMNSARVFGPVVSGALLWQVGPVGAYAAGITLYVIGLACLIGVGSRPPAGGKPGVSVLTQLWEGVRFVLGHPSLASLLGFSLIPMFIALPLQQILVVFAEKVWNTGPQGFGILQAATGAGGVIGAFIVAGMSRRSSLRWMIGSLALFAVGLFAFANSPRFGVALPCLLVANASSSVFATLNNTAVQLLVPDAVRGRVSSFLVMSVSVPLMGAPLLGLAADAFGAPATIGVGALVTFAVGLVSLALSPALRGLDHTLGGGGEPLV